MATNTFAQIPEPTSNIEDLLSTVKALKQTTEMLIGARGTSRPTQTFVSQQPPTALGIGDRWCKPALTSTDKASEYYWNGKDWVREFNLTDITFPSPPGVNWNSQYLTVNTTIPLNTATKVLETPTLGSAGEVWAVWGGVSGTDQTNSGHMSLTLWDDNSPAASYQISYATNAQFWNLNMNVSVITQLTRPTKFSFWCIGYSNPNCLVHANAGRLNACRIA
jgi:hypothetical protein